MPLSLPIAQFAKNNLDKGIIPVSSQAQTSQVDIKTLKSATSSTLNVLLLVDIGDAGIYKTAKKGGIKTIHYVDYTTEKLWVPLIFLPIYFKRYITTVYGE